MKKRQMEEEQTYLCWKIAKKNNNIKRKQKNKQKQKTNKQRVLEIITITLLLS